MTSKYRFSPGILAWLCFFFWCLCSAAAQTPSDPRLLQAGEMVKSELQQRQLDEKEVRRRLQLRGLNVDALRPEQLPLLQTELERIVREMEAEKIQAAQRKRQDSLKIPRPQVDSLPQSKRDTLKQVENRPENPLKSIYGHQLLRAKDWRVFQISKDASPPESYVLGPGDKLNVNIFGASQADLQFEINEEGFIQPQSMPKIFLKGMTLRQARDLLRQRFGAFYVFRSEQFSLNLTSTRNLTVSIFGEVTRNGSFTLPANNTAFNALVAAGGVSEIGSVRRIQLIRDGKTTEFDLYKVLQSPALQYQFFLQNNDVIYVPVAEKVVGIRGAIQRPMRYELLASEELKALLNYAGGLSPFANKNNLQVQRFANERQSFLDVAWADLEKQNRDFALLPGDTISVRAILRPADNFVEVAGEVDFPGKYELSGQLSLSQVLKKAQIRPQARLEAIFLMRQKADQTVGLQKIDLRAIEKGQAPDVLLAYLDRILVYAESQFANRYILKVEGAVRKPLSDTIDTRDTIRVMDLVTLAGGLKPNAAPFAYLKRSNPANLKETSFLRIDLAAASANPRDPANISLAPNDHLLVYAREEFSIEADLQVMGAVNKPGKFAYSAGLSIRDLVLLAGGPKLEAALNRVEVYRLEIKPNESTRVLANTLELDQNLEVLTPGQQGFILAPFDQVVIRQVPDFEFQERIELQGRVRYPGAYALIKANERLSEVVKRAGGLSQEAFAEGATLYRSNGRIGYQIINLQEALAKPGTSLDPILQNGDIVSIPQRENLVSIRVEGTNARLVYPDSLLSNGTIHLAYQGPHSARWYINNYAGGFAEEAKRQSLRIQSSNAKIGRTSKILFFNKYPKVEEGALISLEKEIPKPPKVPGERRKFNWQEFFAQLSAVVTLGLLIRQLQ
jgi:protein involved in polysaccharide export with SLBB domain